MNCSFCSVTAFNGRRFRRRALEDVIQELEQIPQRNVMLTDDNIIGYSQEDRQWAKNLFRRITEKGIKKIFFAQASIQFGEDSELIQLAARAGLRIVFIGLESTNPESLKAYQKGVNLKRLEQDRYHTLIANIRKGGIAVLGAFVLGGDEDDISVFQSTLEFIEASGIDVLQVTKPTPLPGTQLWHDLNDADRLLNQDFPKAWADYRLTKMVFKPQKLSIEEVYEGFTYIREKYYGLWNTFKRAVSTLLTTKNIATAVVAYKFNASYRKAYIDSEHRKIYNRPGLAAKYRRAKPQ